MSIKYDSSRPLLSAILEKTTANATYLIPDLQRPYIWDPSMVILLVDSLFRGWPFGSLLIWKVGAGCYTRNEGLPYRTFWEIVDRTSEAQGIKSTRMEQPADYFMVLDGQQRLQSLVLAFGGDGWGFKLFDHDWANDLKGKRMKNSEHWSKASLCLDLDEFEKELTAKKNKVRKLEVRNIQAWVVIDNEHGQSTKRKPSTYEEPLLKAVDHPGRFLRLSRLWDLTENDLSEAEYRQKLESFLDIQNVSAERIESLKQPLAEFVKLIEGVKAKSIAHCLEIDSFKVSPQWTKDDYNDAIVNIFTRLNSAGRILTQEEITLAWLKIGWVDSKTGGKTAGECLEELQAKLSDQGIKASIDEIVRLLSFLWAMENKGRNGELLESKDLLKGDVIKPMAVHLSERWNIILESIIKAAEIAKQRDLLENIGAFNAIIVSWTWFYLARQWWYNLGQMNQPTKDGFDQKIRSLFNTFQDRWIFSSQWANVWAVSSGQNFRKYGKILHQCFREIASEKNPVNAFQKITQVTDDLLKLVEEDAISFVNSIFIRDRGRVSGYWSLLWIWHRLDSKRWTMSEIPMRTPTKRGGLAKPTLHVDHTVADGYWKRWVDEELARNNSEKAPIQNEDGTFTEPGPGDFETKTTAIEFINTLGNCSLLESSFNISKQDQPLWSFLKQVQQFQENKIDRKEWEDALKMTVAMTDPDEIRKIDEASDASGVRFITVVNDIRKRDEAIRADLIQFIRGKLNRQDLEE